MLDKKSFLEKGGYSLAVLRRISGQSGGRRNYLGFARDERQEVTLLTR